MLYLITEDSNSARDFWVHVLSTFKKESEYRVLDDDKRSGNTTLDYKVSNAFKIMKQGDTLFVAFDNIGNTTNFNSIDFINRVYNRCKARNIKFIFTSYYCFEELYLSYSELLNMYYETITNKNDNTLNTIIYVNKKLNNGENYYNNNSCIKEFIESNNGAGKNREHFANLLLIEVTKHINGFFKISKTRKSLETKGKCWVQSCDDIEKKLHIKQLENMCENKCKYICKHKSSKCKLIHLNDNSLCKNCSIGLYDI